MSCPHYIIVAALLSVDVYCVLQLMWTFQYSTSSDRRKHRVSNFAMSWMHSLWLSSHSSEGINHNQGRWRKWSNIWMHMGRSPGLQCPTTRNFLKDLLAEIPESLVTFAKSIGWKNYTNREPNSPMDSLFALSSEENVGSRWTQFREYLDCSGACPKHHFAFAL